MAIPLLGQNKSRTCRCDSFIFGTSALGSFSTAAYQVAQLCLTSNDASLRWWAVGALTTTCALSIFGFIRSEQHKKASAPSSDDVPIFTPPDDTNAELTGKIEKICTALNLDLTEQSSLQKLQAIHQKVQQLQALSPRNAQPTLDAIELEQ